MEKIEKLEIDSIGFLNKYSPYTNPNTNPNFIILIKKLEKIVKIYYEKIKIKPKETIKKNGIKVYSNKFLQYEKDLFFFREYQNLFNFISDMDYCCQDFLLKNLIKNLIEVFYMKI
jgi:hypothetical protein